MTIDEYNNPMYLNDALALIDSNKTKRCIWFTVINDVASIFEICGNSTTIKAWIPKFTDAGLVIHLGVADFDFEIAYGTKPTGLFNSHCISGKEKMINLLCNLNTFNT